MLLYHGSNVAVREPQLLKVQRELDFGKGFYTTSDFEQAAKWAQRTTTMRSEGTSCISCFEVNEAEMHRLKVLRFEKADRRWLDFVASNRRGDVLLNDWAIIIGPVANDQTFPTILLYLRGLLDVEETIKRLLTQKLKDQYTFKTAEALSLLRFVEVRYI